MNPLSPSYLAQPDIPKLTWCILCRVWSHHLAPLQRSAYNMLYEYRSKLIFQVIPNEIYLYFGIWIEFEGKKQGKSEGFDRCDQPSNITQIGFKSSFLCL